MVGWALDVAERCNLGPLMLLDTVERANVSGASNGVILALRGLERNGTGGVARDPWPVTRGEAEIGGSWRMWLERGKLNCLRRGWTNWSDRGHPPPPVVCKI